MKKYRDPFLWFLCGMVAMFQITKMVPTGFNYHAGYDAAMEEAFKLGLAEKLVHPTHGAFYSFLP